MHMGGVLAWQPRQMPELAGSTVNVPQVFAHRRAMKARIPVSWPQRPYSPATFRYSSNASR